MQQGHAQAPGSSAHRDRVDDEALLLSVRGVRKGFPGVQALDGVDLSVAPGEVHALLGENGAGKSTLLKILSGAQHQDEGTIRFGGQLLPPMTPVARQRLGIVTIYQELTLAPNLSVAENIFIGREPVRAGLVDWRRMARDARTLIQRLGLAVDPMTPVSLLSVAEQQMVEIARALSMRSRLIIMDEPTSSLSSSEVDKLFAIVRELRAQGIGMIIVTHKLDEVMGVCDRYTVMRDGRYVGSGAVAETSIPHLIRLMVGRELVEEPTQRRVPAEAPGLVVLEVRGLSSAGNPLNPHAVRLHDISLRVRRGEVLGIAGLVGAGRTELARAIFGADPFDQGEILIEGRPVRQRTPRDAIRNGVGLVPEDRKQQALFLGLAIRNNLSITALDDVCAPGGLLVRAREDALVERFRAALNIRMSGPAQQVLNLSGGNQQKVVLARWLALGPKVLIVDEPTRGIDVGAKAEVHKLLRDMARDGLAVIAISSELSEVLAISDRILTVRNGRITGDVPRHEATQEGLMSLMALASAPEPIHLHQAESQ